MSLFEVNVMPLIGMDGKQQHTYQYDSNKHRLFTSPHRITTNNNKDIVVVDGTSGDTGRVVVEKKWQVSKKKMSVVKYK
jgi:spermidine synthase